MSRKSDTTNTRKTMPITGHVQELQVRLVLSAIVLIVAGSLAYAFQKPLIDILLAPLEGANLVYLTPGGGFSFVMLVCIYVGLAAASPVIIHQLYCFVRPALSPKVQRYSLRVLFLAFLLLISGVVFGYLVVIPGALDFLYGFAADYIDPTLTGESYINFLVAYTLGLGIVFQLPLLLMLIHWIKPLTPSGLLKSERWVIVLAFVAAAIISPTVDPLNQVIIALPVILLYQFGVIAVLISIRKERRQNAKLAPETAPTPQPQPIAEVSPIVEPLPIAAPTQPTPHRSLDGFISHPTRKSSHNLAAPTRPVAASRPAERPTYSRRLSLDGVSRIA